LDLCFPAAFEHDPRVQALVRLLRGSACRRLISELPGYHARETGEMRSIPDKPAVADDRFERKNNPPLT
jgi:hypothetical protein